jgi:6-phosphogluconolactonase (cycloisomerase 2 family)
MTYTLLAGGYRDSIAILTFTPPSTAGGAGKLTLVTEAPSPPSPSWVESAGERVYAVSETDTGGDLAVFDLVRSANGEVMGIKVAHKDEAGVAPCHILRDGERLVVSNVSAVRVTGA